MRVVFHSIKNSRFYYLKLQIEKKTSFSSHALVKELVINKNLYAVLPIKQLKEVLCNTTVTPKNTLHEGLKF